MARFKASDLLVKTNDEILFGDSQEVSMKYDGSDLIVNSPILASDPVSAGHLATKTWVENNTPDATSGLIWQDSVLEITQTVPPTGSYGDRYIAIVPSGTAYDPGNTHAFITLSNENLTTTCTNTGSWTSAITNTFLTSGKWYWEVTIDVWPVSSFMPGIARTDMSTLHFPGQIATGVGYYDNTGQAYYNGVPTAYGDAYSTPGDVIGVALDLDNGKVFFSLNDVWQNSGDPVAGTNPAQTITSALGWGPAIGLTTDLAAATMNVGSAAWAGTIPTGYTGVGDTGVDWFNDDMLDWGAGASSYTILTPSAGFATWVVDEGVYYIFDGSDWGRFGGVIDHGQLQGLTDDDHDSLYPLITNFEADRGTIATNWTDLTDGGDTTLHDHDGITENSAARHTQGTDTTLGTMTDDIDLDSYKLTTTGNVSAGGFYLGDSGRLHLGTDNDSKIYQDGSNAFWDNSTGDVRIRFGTDIAIKATKDGSVTLYNDGISRLVTGAAGITVTGDVAPTDDFYASGTGSYYMGDTPDAQIYHNNSHCYWDIVTGTAYIRVNSASENVFTGEPNGGVTLFWDGNERFRTRSDGIVTTGDGVFTGTLEVSGNITTVGNINVDTTKFINVGGGYIQNSGTDFTMNADAGVNLLFLIDGDDAINADAGGSVTLYHNTNQKFSTEADGINVTGNGLFTGSITASGNIRTGSDIRVSDGNFIYLGTTNQASLTHIGGHFYLDNTAGNTYLRIGGENGIVIAPDAQVQLYYDNNAKLATTATGIDVTGEVSGDTFTVATSAGDTGWFDDGANFRITVTAGIITDIGASIAGGIG